MGIALAVVVVLLAALAVVFWHFYTVLDRRISDILSESGYADQLFTVPEDLKNTYPAVLHALTEMDITGAWAAEQARRGVNVSDEEIAEQRKMWAQEGFN